FFSSRRRHTRSKRDWSSDVCSSDLLDVWAKKNTPDTVYYDITWTGFVGKAPSDKMREVFNVVRQGRDIGVKTVQQAVSAGRAIAGWEVDRAVRAFLNDSGFGDLFMH